MSNRFLLLRFTHQTGRLAGRSNDWAIAVIGDAIEIRTGRTGEILTRRPLLRTNWSMPTASDEADKRWKEQMQQSYEIVGHCSFTPEGLAIDISPVVEGMVVGVPINTLLEDTERKPPALFWSVRAEDWATARGIMEEVAAVNEQLAPRLDLRWIERRGMPTSVPVVDGYVFAFSGYSGSGVLRWDGEVPKGSPATVLLWILLFRKHGGQAVTVTAADAAGNEITGLRLADKLGVLRDLGGADIDTVKPLALSLGLISTGLEGVRPNRMKRFTFS